MSDRLCIIYQVTIPPKESASHISDQYYSTKQEAMQVGRENQTEVYRINVRGDGGIREAVCRVAKHQGWISGREKIADFKG